MNSKNEQWKLAIHLIGIHLTLVSLTKFLSIFANSVLQNALQHNYDPGQALESIALQYYG